jgi:hypothetical protein
MGHNSHVFKTPKILETSIFLAGSPHETLEKHTSQNDQAIHAFISGQQVINTEKHIFGENISHASIHNFLENR